MSTIATTCAALLSAAAVTVPASPAMADGAAAAAATGGCVTNTQYARLAVGQRLSHTRAIVSDQAQSGDTRRWWSGANAYQERRYTMCTPVDAAHGTLTMRFMVWQGAWRAQIVDTLVGPEPR